MTHDTLTPAEQLRKSFEMLNGKESELARALYAELFTINPTLKHTLFSKTDFENQRKMLIGALHYIIMNFERRSALEKHLRKLGDKHVQYGVTTEHYAQFGESLLRAMAKVNGPKWTPKLELLWRTAFEDVAETMLGQNAHSVVSD